MLDPNKLYGVGGNKSLRETVEREYINEMLNDVRRAADDAITRIHNAPPFESMFSEDPVYIGTWVNGKKIYRHVKNFDTRDMYLGELWDDRVEIVGLNGTTSIQKVSCQLKIPLGNHDAVWTNSEENAALKRYRSEEIFIVNEPDMSSIGSLNPSDEIVLSNENELLGETDVPFRVGVNRDGPFWTPSDAFSDVQFSEELVEINHEWYLSFKFDITCKDQYHFVNLPKKAGYHNLYRVINYVG